MDRLAGRTACRRVLETSEGRAVAAIVAREQQADAVTGPESVGGVHERTRYWTISPAGTARVVRHGSAGRPGVLLAASTSHGTAA